MKPYFPPFAGRVENLQAMCFVFLSSITTFGKSKAIPELSELDLFDQKPHSSGGATLITR
jgi:hypothetical protein